MRPARGGCGEWLCERVGHLVGKTKRRSSQGLHVPTLRPESPLPHRVEVAGIRGQGLALCNWSAFVVGHAHPAFSSKHTGWWYDGITMTLQAKAEWGSQFPYVEHTAKWSEVLIDSHTNQDLSPLENVNAHFRIEYCWKNF